MTLLRRQHEVQLALGGGSTIAAAWTDDSAPAGLRGWSCGYSVSTDGGVIWSVPLRRKHPGFAVTGNPAIAVDRAGVVFAIAMAATEDYSAGALEIARSADGGRSWSPWRTVLARSGGFADRPKLAITSDGALVLVYAAVRRTGRRLKTLESAIEVMRSADQGARWDRPRPLSSCRRRSRWFIDGAQGAAVLTAPGGLIRASWADYYGNHAHVAVSEDGGRSFAPPQSMRLQTIPGRGVLSLLLGATFGTPATELAVDPSGERIVLSVHEAHALGPIILLGSRDRGRCWSRLTRLSGRGTNAALAFDGAGRLHALWTEQQGTRIDTRYALSADPERIGAQSVSLAGGGVEIEPPRSAEAREEAPLALGSYQSLVIDARGTVFAAWVDLRDGWLCPRLRWASWQADTPGLSGAGRS